MDPARITILISIQPQWCLAIRNGSKRYEFRRSFSRRLKPPILAAIYESRPVQAVTMILEISNIISDSSEKLAGLVEGRESQLEILKYFQGKEKGFALPIAHTYQIFPEITLKEIVEVNQAFRPPVNYQTLQDDSPIITMLSKRNINLIW